MVRFEFHFYGLHTLFYRWLLVPERKEVYICDMGVARLQETLATILTSRGQGARTILYKAPEIFIAAKRSTPVDNYSYGCLLIELCSGRRVREGMSTTEVLAVMCGPNPNTGNVQEPYKSIYAKCTQYKPEDRPTATEVLKEVHSSAS